ncbi:MAG: hypothetical protein MMC33_001323 [Icmadophila ericetorum]|nr:hypothetical protein [Icmadophila ericetorum]
MATQPLDKLQSYVNKVKGGGYEPVTAQSKAAHEARLNKTLFDLQALVRQQQSAIEQLKANNQNSEFDRPSTDPAQHLKQLRILKAAYENLASEEPYLPSSDTGLPALLAVRKNHRSVEDIKQSISANYEGLKRARQQLNQEETHLKDARLIAESLEKRIAKLRGEYEEKSQRSPEEIAKATIEQQRQRLQDQQNSVKTHSRALRRFIENQLAGMLAAENIGGPILGDIQEVTDEMLIKGFNRTGGLKKKTKKIKPRNKNGNKSQQKIDRMLNNAEDATKGEADNEVTVDEAVNDEEDVQELKATAAEEMKLLVEELLNVAVDDEARGTYTVLERDSAASRFLVRANVAQFHPEDARKIRLLDFARGIDD